MGMLMILKEGGSLLIDTIGNLVLDEDVDLLAESSVLGISLGFRTITDSLSTTNTSTANRSRAIVMGV